MSKRLCKVVVSFHVEAESKQEVSDIFSKFIGPIVQENREFCTAEIESVELNPDLRAPLHSLRPLL